MQQGCLEMRTLADLNFAPPIEWTIGQRAEIEVCFACNFSLARAAAALELCV